MARFIALAIMLSCLAAPSLAQTPPPAKSGEQTQPQGPTGPINTDTTKGAPAGSPQGETPPGMQSAPQGSGAPAPPKEEPRK